MSQSIDTVIAKINHLRKLSSNNANQHEAEAAAAAADRLIAQHQLSEMDLQIKTNKEAETIEIIDDYLYTSGRIMLWKSNLAVNLCRHYGCEVFVTTIRAYGKAGSRGTEKAFQVVGRRSDFDIIKYMFGWLVELIEQCVRNEAYGMGHAFSQSYALGIVAGIKNQLTLQKQQQRRDATRQNMTQAMVLLDNRLAETKNYMELRSKLPKNHPDSFKLRKGQASKQTKDNGAFYAGVAKGESIELTKGLGSGSGANKLLK